MSGLQYVGRAPDSDFSVVHKKWVDDRYAQVKVDLAYVNSATTAALTSKVTTDYVDTQDNLRAKSADVDAADATYVPLSQKNQANGIATIGPDGYIPAAQLPALSTQRKVSYKFADTIYLTGTQSVQTTSAKEYKAATLTIPDPGFPYVPLAFADIQGGSTSGAQGTRTEGTGSFGQISILDPTDVKYGWGICTDMKTLAYYKAIPYGPVGKLPAAVNGPLTLDLWLALWAGQTYIFTGASLLFWAMVYPSM